MWRNNARHSVFVFGRRKNKGNTRQFGASLCYCKVCREEEEEYDDDDDDENEEKEKEEENRRRPRTSSSRTTT